MRWLREWWVTIRHGSPLTRSGREFRRNLRDPLSEYVEVDRPAMIALGLAVGVASEVRAQERAAEKGESVSDVVRRALERYVRSKR